MTWILHPEDLTPLWRQYMDELTKIDIQKRTKWCKPATTIPYSQWEFLVMLKLDEEFNKRWSRLRSEVRQEKIEEILRQVK